MPGLVIMPAVEATGGRYDNPCPKIGYENLPGDVSDTLPKFRFRAAEILERFAGTPLRKDRCRWWNILCRSACS